MVLCCQMFDDVQIDLSQIFQGWIRADVHSWVGGVGFVTGWRHFGRVEKKPKTAGERSWWTFSLVANPRLNQSTLLPCKLFTARLLKVKMKERNETLCDILSEEHSEWCSLEILKDFYYRQIVNIVCKNKVSNVLLLNDFLDLGGSGMQFYVYYSLVKIDTSIYSDLPKYSVVREAMDYFKILISGGLGLCIRGGQHNMSTKLGGFRTPHFHSSAFARPLFPTMILWIQTKTLLAENSHRNINILKDCRLVEGARDLTY